jgi:hypothetical protein
MGECDHVWERGDILEEGITWLRLRHDWKAPESQEVMRRVSVSQDNGQLPNTFSPNHQGSHRKRKISP